MFRRHSWFWRRVFQSIDLSIIAAAWLLTVSQAALPLDLPKLGFVLGAWLLVSTPFELYLSRRLAPLREEIAELTFICFLYAALILLLMYAGWLPHLSTVRFAFEVWFGVVGFHLAVRIVLRFVRTLGLNQRRVLIYGAGEIGRRTARAMSDNRHVGLRVIGFLDDEPRRVGSVINCGDVQLPVLGTSVAARKLVQGWVIQEVVVAQPMHQSDRIKTFIREIGDMPINVRVVPDLLDVISVTAKISAVADIPLIGVRQPSIEGAQAAVKRGVDVAVAAVGLLVAAPVLAAIALMIRRDGDGPVLFRQQRVGLNGQLFTLYKFRTMVADADRQLTQLINLDALEEPVFKIKNDPRVTKIGRFLRKTSLDELPQLYNVLRGDMSLVGPRPEESRIVDMYTYQQRKRLAVKPGLTGPMQTGGRGNLTFEERLRLDLDYIENYSLFRDIIFLIKTVPAVLFKEGAY